MNTRPSVHRILCLGDSNTWGYIPGSAHQRYPADRRWTGVLQTILGDEYEILEEGLNSRTLESEDLRPNKEGRPAATYILPCLDSQDPVEAVIVMLGTNELKTGFGLEPTEIAAMLERLIDRIQGRISPIRRVAPAILLVSPPAIVDTTDYCLDGDSYRGATERGASLLPLFKDLAEQKGCAFFDAASVGEIGSDGLHLTEAGHRTLAEGLAPFIPAVIGCL